MWLAIISIITGVLVGSILTVSVPIVFAKYLSVAVLAALDSLLGGMRAILEDDFDGTIMLSGFITNALMAAALAFLGDKMGLDLYLVAVITFGLRIFGNLGYIRRDILTKLRQKHGKAPQEKGILLPEVSIMKETAPSTTEVLSASLTSPLLETKNQEAADDHGQSKEN